MRKAKGDLSQRCPARWQWQYPGGRSRSLNRPRYLLHSRRHLRQPCCAIRTRQRACATPRSGIMKDLRY